MSSTCRILLRVGVASDPSIRRRNSSSHARSTILRRKTVAGLCRYSRSTLLRCSTDVAAHQVLPPVDLRVFARSHRARYVVARSNLLRSSLFSCQQRCRESQRESHRKTHQTSRRRREGTSYSSYRLTNELRRRKLIHRRHLHLRAEGKRPESH